MIYVMGDIHGNEKRFRSVMKKIRLKPEDTLYVLGDVMDRYPGGWRILKKLLSMPNVKLILGNHEYMLLDAIGTEYSEEETFLLFDRMSRWYRNGGRVTHVSFQHLTLARRQEVFDILRSLPTFADVTAGGRTFRLIHGGDPDEYNPRYDRDYRDRTEYAVWYRIRGDEDWPEDRTYVFGHTPTGHYQYRDPMSVWHSPDGRFIGIDCGCGYPEDGRAGNGRLACLRLDDLAEFYSDM